MNQFYRFFVLTGFLLVIMHNANASITNADNKNNITALQGVVTDRFTGEALTGVSVKLNETGEVTYTDFDGNFKFNNVEPGTYDITFSYISYRDKTEKGVATKTTVKGTLEIKLSKQ